MIKVDFTIEELRYAWRCFKTSTDSIKGVYMPELYVFEGQNNKSLEKNIRILQEKLSSGNYMPQRPLKYNYPKRNNSLTTLQKIMTCLTPEDFLVYQALTNRIMRKSENLFQKIGKVAFGHVLQPESHKQKEADNYYYISNHIQRYEDFKKAYKKKSEKHKCIIRLDISNFFNSIPHSIFLLKLSQNKWLDKEQIELLKICLCVWSGTHEVAIPGIGIPQPSCASSLLAHLYLSTLDIWAMDNNINYLRFVDDIFLYTDNKTKLEAEDNLILASIKLKIQNLGLTFNHLKAEIIINNELPKELPLPLSEMDNDLSEDTLMDYEYECKKEKMLDEIDDEGKFNEKQEKKDSFGFDSLPLNKRLNLIRSMIFDNADSPKPNYTEMRELAFIFNSTSQKIFFSLGKQDLNINYALTLINVLQKYPHMTQYLCIAIRIFVFFPEIQKKLVAVAIQFKHMEFVQAYIFEVLNTSIKIEPKLIDKLLEMFNEGSSWYADVYLFLLLKNQIHIGDSKRGYLIEIAHRRRNEGTLLDKIDVRLKFRNQWSNIYQKSFVFDKSPADKLSSYERDPPKNDKEDIAFIIELFTGEKPSYNLQRIFEKNYTQIAKLAARVVDTLVLESDIPNGYFLQLSKNRQVQIMKRKLETFIANTIRIMVYFIERYLMFYSSNAKEKIMEIIKVKSIGRERAIFVALKEIDSSNPAWHLSQQLEGAYRFRNYLSHNLEDKQIILSDPEEQKYLLDLVETFCNTFKLCSRSFK